MTATETNLSLLLEYVTHRHWALHEPTLQRFVDVLDRHVRGVSLSEAQIADITAARNAKGSNEREYEVDANGQAIIPVSGVIAKYSRMVNGVSQPRGTSVEALSDQLAMAVADPKVHSIFLHIESPGGTISGLADFADEVYQASQRKPVVAFIDDLGVSAAYWIASQATRVYANQTASVGSVGVYSILVDSSARAKTEGIKVNIVASGKFKAVGTPGTEITNDGIENVRGQIDSLHGMFFEAVLRGRNERGLTAKSLEPVADGRVFLAAAAEANGLIDGVMTLQQALAAAKPGLRKPGETKTQHTHNQTAVASAEEKSPIGKESTMTEHDATQPDAAALEKLRSEAATAERDRITTIDAALVGEHLAEVRTLAIKSGSSVTEAKAAAFAASEKHYAAAVADKDEQLATANTRLEAVKGGDSTLVAGETTEEAKAEADKADEADENAKAASGDDVEKYEAEIEKQKANGAPGSTARMTAAQRYPKAHKTYVEKLQAEQRAG